MRHTRNAAPAFDEAARKGGRGESARYVRPPGDAAATVDITVYDTPEVRGYEQTAEEAIFILSQSATGRRLMGTAIAADYGIVFMDDADKNLRGYVDTEQKLVFLARTEDPRRLALTLGHELAHVSQTVNSDIKINVIRDHPLDALKKFMAIEADARAYEIKIAIELEFPAAANTLRFDGLLDIAAHKTDIGALPALADKIRPQLPDGIAHDKIMAACFRAFYYDINLRATYEAKVMSRIEQTSDTAMPDKTAYSRRIGDDELMQRLDGHDVLYIQKNRPHTDIADPRLKAVSTYTAARLEDLRDLRRGAGFDTSDWHAPVYRAEAEAAPKAPAPKPSAPKGPQA